MTGDDENQRTPFAVIVNGGSTQVNVLTGLLRKQGLDVRAFQSADAALSGMDRSAPPGRIAADLGAEAFLPSPVDGKRFVEQVRAILRGEKPRTSPRVPIVEASKTLAGASSTGTTSNITTAASPC